MQVFEQCHPRAAAAERGIVQHPLHETMKPLLALLDIGRRRRIGEVGDAEQVEDDRQVLAVAFVHGSSAPEIFARAASGPSSSPTSKEGAPELQHRQHRRRLTVGEAARLENRNAARAAFLDELRAEPRLPGAGLSHEPDHLTAAARPLERGLERGQIVISPNEHRKTARAGTVQPRAERARALKVEQRHRFGDALHLGAAEVAQLKIAVNQTGSVFRNADMAGLGELFHALRQSDAVTQRGELHAQVVADPSNHDLVGVEPHPDAKLHAVPLPNGFGENAHGVADVQGGEASSLRVIFVGDGGPEKSHGAVAGELMQRTLEAVYAFGDDLKEVLDDAEPLFRVELRRKSSSNP